MRKECCSIQFTESPSKGHTFLLIAWAIFPYQQKDIGPGMQVSIISHECIEPCLLHTNFTRHEKTLTEGVNGRAYQRERV